MEILFLSDSNMIIGKNELSSWLFYYLIAKNDSKLLLKSKNDVPAHLWMVMNQYAKSVYLQYREDTENLAFLRISDKFFRYLFWFGEIYVNCTVDGDGTLEVENDLSSIDIYVKINIEVLRKSDIIPEDVLQKLKFEDENNVFMDLTTGCLYQITNWKSDLIKVEWSDEDNFVSYYLFVSQEFVKKSRVDNLIREYSFNRLSFDFIDGSLYKLENNSNERELDIVIPTIDSNVEKVMSMTHKEMTSKEIDVFDTTTRRRIEEERSLLEGKNALAVLRAGLDRLKYFSECFFRKYNIRLLFVLRQSSKK